MGTGGKSCLLLAFPSQNPASRSPIALETNKKSMLDERINAITAQEPAPRRLPKQGFILSGAFPPGNWPCPGRILPSATAYHPGLMFATRLCRRLFFVVCFLWGVGVCFVVVVGFVVVVFWSKRVPGLRRFPRRQLLPWTRRRCAPESRPFLRAATAFSSAGSCGVWGREGKELLLSFKPWISST